jgi:Ca2+-binding RTX toxin-like protein
MPTTVIAGNTTFVLLDNLSPDRQAGLKLAIETLAASSYASELFGTTRTIQVTNVSNGSTHTSDMIFLDAAESTNTSYIDLFGNKAPLTERSVFVHELIHLVTGKLDVLKADGTEALSDDYPDLVLAPSSDFLGETVRHTNSVMRDVFGEQPRGHYFDVFLGNNEANLSESTKALWKQSSYTNGQAVDQVITTPSIGPVDWTIDRRGSLSTGSDPQPSRDLIIGYDGKQVVFAGAGADFVYGGANDDSLSGGQGTDFLFGGDDDDILAGGDVTDFQDVVLRDYHPEWNDGVKDVLRGGSGNDRYLISHENDYNYSGTLAESLELIDIIDETAGDGVGEIWVQNHKVTQMAGGQTVETTDAIAIAGTYEALSTNDNGTYYRNISWTTDDLAQTQWVAGSRNI